MVGASGVELWVPKAFLTVMHHVRVTGTAGGVRIGETGELVSAVVVYNNLDGKGLTLFIVHHRYCC